jgi:PBP1b-binding outer membrane lipoprotein LpoB
MLPGRTTAFIRIAITAAALLAAGCESMPVQEMSDARQAIMAAREAGAEEHAAEVLLEAEESLQSAEKYLNSRNYGVARREAIEAKTKAIDALHVSEASRESQN